MTYHTIDRIGEFSWSWFSSQIKSTNSIDRMSPNKHSNVRSIINKLWFSAKK